MPDIQPPVVDNSQIPQPVASSPPPQPTQPRPPSGYGDIASVSSGKTSGRKVSLLAYGFIIGAVLVIVGIGGFYLYQYTLNKNIADLTQSNNDKKKELSAGKYAQAEKDLADLAAQVTNYNKVIASQTDYSQLFTLLRTNTYVKAKYNTFSYSNDGKITISGSTETYTDLGKFLRSFTKSPQVQKFSLGTFSGGSGDSKGVQFSVSFVYQALKTQTPTVQPTTQGGQ